MSIKRDWSRTISAITTGLLVSACHTAPRIDSNTMPFSFPEDDGNYRVTGNKRIDVIFPLESRDFTTCSSTEYRQYSMTRYRSLSFYILHLFPTGELALGANAVTTHIDARLDSVTVTWDPSWSPERIRALQTDPQVARFDSAATLDSKQTNDLLKTSTLTAERLVGEPPLLRGSRTIKLTDAMLQDGRLRFSVSDSAAVELMLRPNNVSVAMSWCHPPRKETNLRRLNSEAQVTIERRP